jgi:patatin-like phospholipase/acyl hydrolase
MGHQRVPFNPCANHTLAPVSRKVEDADAMLFYDGSLRVKDCCAKSAAAPTYFPSHQGQVDGGMFANVRPPPPTRTALPSL